MKGVLFLLFLFLGQSLYAQSECDTLKGVHSNYIYRKYSDEFHVYEENSKWDREDQRNFSMSPPYPTMYLKNMNILSRLMKENIKPYIKPEHIGFGNNFRFNLYFNEQGKILELYFAYRQDLIIPVSAIENLDRGIKENCYIAISGPKNIFEGAAYHRYIFTYSLKDIFNENISEEDLKVRLWW